MKAKKVIITGGAGFIGSHLAEELVKRGYYVVILDNLSTGKRENITELLKNGNVEFIQGSITDLSLLQPMFRGVQYVFHQAALGSVPRSVANPLASHETNITGTLNVLLAARDNKVKKVILASSSSVYGDTPTLPKKEDMPPHPLSPYAVTKLSGEYYSQVFQEVYQLPTVCLRYFNVYGPRQDPNSQYAAVIPNFIKKANNSESPVIFGNGEQTRDFTFVKDVVAANILAAESEICGLFNISRGESVTINQIAKLISDLVENRVKPIYQKPRPGDVLHSLADVSRARSFGYKSQYTLDMGLAETINWFKGR